MFRGKVVGVSLDHIRFPGGHETYHEVLHLPAAVCVLPLLDGEGGRRQAILVEQFRNSVEGFIHEVPAGILEKGEDPAGCASRELEEETGYRASRVTHLTTLLPIPGTSAHLMHFYLAEGLTPGRQRLEAGECLTVKEFPLDELVTAVLDPDPASRRVAIVDAKTHISILHAAMLFGMSPVRGSRP